MNLYFRLFRVILAAFFRPRAGLLEETSVTFRVGPGDLDALWHVNNGKYFSLMDLGRLDMIIRTGIGRVLRKNRWYPVIASEGMRFKQSLTLGQQFELRTTPLGWDDKSFYLRQTFLRGDRVIAVGVIRARFLSKNGGTVDAPEIANAVSPGAKSPVLPDYLEAWQATEEALS